MKTYSFCLCLPVVLKAVDDHAELLRESAAVREMIIDLAQMKRRRQLFSVFLGDQLEDVMEQLEIPERLREALKAAS